ncbi:GSCOCG00002642001-RA-CDS [Cotesia congregata]|nr:GSCOCG00002642001-RA-CDS [Cotesia congregata]
MCSLITRKLFTTTNFYKSIVAINKNVKLAQIGATRYFADTKEPKLAESELKTDEATKLSPSPGLQTGHQVFRDEDSEVIFDVEEEMKKIDFQKITELEQEIDPFAGINLKHGVTGVYDIEDLVDLLKKEKAKDVFVVSVSKELGYGDYIVVTTGKSLKHMSALATVVRKVYKLKRYSTDIIPKIEGEKCKDWMAIDLGNIVLHIFSKTAREDYDLETLWALGSKYDKRTNDQKEMSLEFEEKYKQFLDSLQPDDQPSTSVNSKSI